MLTLLKDNGPLRVLVTARAVSVVGDALSLVTLMLHVQSVLGKAIAVAALLLVGDFAPALLSPLTGVVGDRFDRRTVMVVCEAAQGVLLAVIALTLPPLPVLLVLVGVRAVIGQIFLPASRAAVPSLVAGEDLARANTALGFGSTGADVIGPLLAAALLTFLDTRGVLLVDAVSFGLSALVLLRLPALVVAPEPGESVLAGARAGLSEIWRNRALRILFLGFCGVVACTAIDDVAVLQLTTEVFGEPDNVAGIVLGAVGAGLLAGYALLARGSARMGVVALLITGFVVSSAGNLFTGLAWGVASAFALQAVRGLGIAAMDVAHSTLIQRLVPAERAGRVFGNFYGGIGVAAAVSYIGGGLLLDAVGPRLTFVLAGGAGVLVAGWVVAAARAGGVEWEPAS
ncbi:Predicted arabinose efflux permease, MFS family [Lentzea xinjiangensis]|uniref:Predicted arabinose efflux permease, MFS family n=1 Tax=Lentzea xinjiangensis TaxID=402600 RepID=A0A1H9WQU8_9PSEU|nr:MFS transporter [Lentzea xinjiangensis]SES36302.1 Predicted arabinose efflux permease, MFS family [Lentzea xinjiangensis]